MITPAALERLSGIHQKQLWNYLHGRSKPCKQQIEKIEKALYSLGAELMSISLYGEVDRRDIRKNKFGCYLETTLFSSKKNLVEVFI